MTIIPPRLEPGDTIGIIAPAGPVNRDEILPAIDLLNKRGYHTVTSRNLYRKKGYLAGSDEVRLEGLQSMFLNRDIKAIFCARGGYGSIRLLDSIDYGALKKNPKIIAGYSDITALLLAIFRKTGLITFHGPVMRDLNRGGGKDIVDLLDLLASGLPRSMDMSGGKALRQGRADGVLLGGNLSLMCSMIGTPYMPVTRGAILFIEDRGEPLYRIDRMLNHLRLSGIMGGLSGLMAGTFTECGGKRQIDGLLKEITSDLEIPVVSGLPVGHGRRNRAVPVGLPAHLDTGAMRLSFSAPCVT